MAPDDKIEQLETVFKALYGKVNPEKTALIVIDMQDYQVRKEGAEYKILDMQVPGVLDYFVERVETLVEPNLVELVSLCRERNVKVIFTKYCSFTGDGSDLTPREREANALSMKIVGDITFPPADHPLSSIIPSLEPTKDDIVIIKNTSGTFLSTALETMLRNMDVDTLLVTGVVTHFCVISTAREASDLGFNTVIIEDCCAGWSEALHEATLTTFALSFGTVTTLKRIKRMLKSRKTSKEK